MTDSDIVELAPCPFCGNERRPRVVPATIDGAYGGESFRWGYWVQCDASGFDGDPGRGCGACSGWGETPDDAIAAWNRRSAARTPLSGGCEPRGPGPVTGHPSIAPPLDAADWPTWAEIDEVAKAHAGDPLMAKILRAAHGGMMHGPQGLRLLYDIRHAMGWNDLTGLSIMPAGIAEMRRSHAATITALREEVERLKQERRVIELPMVSFDERKPERDPEHGEQTFLTYCERTATWDIVLYESGWEEEARDFLGATHWLDITSMWPGVAAQVTAFNEAALTALRRRVVELGGAIVARVHERQTLLSTSAPVRALATLINEIKETTDG